MRLQTVAEQMEFRREIQTFLDRQVVEAPASWRGGLECPFVTDDNWEFHRSMARKIAEKGWSVSMWPSKYGGREISPIEHILIEEVVGYCKAGGIDIFANMIGPAIFKYGTEEQKMFHLPKMANGEVMWSQGWSEPNAGSDLASLKTRAERNGDHYVVNGQKVWTSNAHRADWMFLVARTNPKAKRSKGLSVFLVDMKTKGITIRPIRSMNGEESFNEVFFDDMIVPAENLLGEEDKGWEITTSLMSYERMGMAGEIGFGKRLLDDLTDYCRQTPTSTGPLFENPRVGMRLAELAVEAEVVRSLCYELGRMMSNIGDDNILPFASVIKVSTSEFNQRVAYAGIEILGGAGQIEGISEWAPLGGDFEHFFQSCINLNIAGGTSEIQRNVIAWNALGLPRS